MPVDLFPACISPKRPAAICRLAMAIIFILLSASGYAQVTAAFKATDTAGCAPLVIRFTNTSTGAATYAWDLGNTHLSSTPDVSATYFTAGTYTVTLAATNGSVTNKTSMVIRVYDKPSVNFSTSTSNACPGAPVLFSNSSTPNAWGSLSYTWNFGNGASSTLSSPAYIFSQPGTYNITLFAMNSKGCVNALTKSAYVTILPSPAVDFAATATDYCNYPATDTVNSNVSGKSPFIYNWSMGDGSISTAVNSVHIYTAPGSYTVKLSVKDGNGCVDSLIQRNYINVNNFTASFSGPAAGCRGTLLSFSNTTAGSVSEQWDFGDSTPLSDDATHTWTADGTYTVRLIAYNGSCYSTASHAITISHETGDFTISQLCAPASTVVLTAIAPAGSAIDWRYGDGYTGTGTTVTHTYDPDDRTRVYTDIHSDTMIFTSPLGCRDTIVKTDSLKNLWVSTANSSLLTGCLPHTVTFRADPKYSIHFSPINSADLNYPYAIASYLWDPGDGSPIQTTPSPSHIYTAAGVYRVTCSITTTNGCKASTTSSVSAGTLPAASFTISKSKVCAGTPIYYEVTSKAPTYQYRWSFDDGIEDNRNPAYSGTDTIKIRRSKQLGVFQVTLTVNDRGCENSYSLYDTITGTAALFDNAYACIPANKMLFTNTSAGDDGHTWFFEGGLTFSTSGVTHSFPSLTNYPITLTTFNTATGCRDTITKLIELGRVTGSIQSMHTVACKGAAEEFRLIAGGTDTTSAISNKWYVNGTLVTPHLTRGDSYIGYFDSLTRVMTLTGDNVIQAIVTDNHSCQDTMTLTEKVAKPIDSFRVSPVSVCPYTNVTFTDVSKGTPGVPPVSYYWNFGDGTTSTMTTPIVNHAYLVAGTYTVTGIVTDAAGCKDTLRSPTHPAVKKPASSFTVNLTYVCAKDSITFNNTSREDHYLWLFGDGATSTAVQTGHRYTLPGTYHPSLVSYSVLGCTDTFTLADSIAVKPLPKASFSMDDTFAVCPPLNVNFINTSADAASNTWLFGDGNFSNEVYPSNIYTGTGAYSITLIATNGYGCSDMATGSVRIFGGAGGLSYTPETVCMSSPVTFTAKFPHVISMVWDYGAGEGTSPPVTTDTVMHVYSQPGRYIPSLVLTSVSGCHSASIGTDTIKVDSITADFTAVPTSACTNSPVSFTDASIRLFSPATNWSWAFGSGATGTGSNPSYAFPDTGIQAVTLKVTNQTGCTSVITKTISVIGGPSAIAGTAFLCTGQPSLLSSSTAGGSWYSSNTSVAIVSTAGVATGIRSGTAVISYTLASGCSTTMVATVSPTPSLIGAATRICATQTTTLTTGSTGGSWSSSRPGIAIVGLTNGFVTGILPGTATISYSLPTGCSASAVVVVDTMPDVISGTSKICAGNSAMLSDAVPGGTWHSSNTSVLAADASTGNITGVGTGSATVSYMLSSGCKVTHPVTVNGLPTAITGGTDVCVGMEIALSADVTGTWSSSNASVAIVGSAGVVQGVTAGTATITYTNPSGCISTASITVNGLPGAISGPKDICIGVAASFSDASSGGTWATNGIILTIDAMTGTANGSGTGTATITYTTSTGCYTTTSVTIHPIPSSISGPGNICIGLVTTLSDADRGGTWSTIDTTVSVEIFSGAVKGIVAGTASIAYTSADGCNVLATVTVYPLPPAITGSTNICPGTSSTLSSAPGGTWGSGNTAVATVDISGTVTGIAAGTATITYLSDEGCPIKETVTVYPVVMPIRGTTRLCKGDTAVLIDFSPAGKWSSSDTMIAKISAEGTVKGLATGTAIISYSAMNTCDTATAAVTVLALPDAGTIVAPHELCQGSSVTFADTVTGGVWTSDNNIVATIDYTSGIVTGHAPGTATLTYTYKNSCGIAQTSVVLTINEQPHSPRITTRPDTILCSNTQFMNFGTDIPAAAGTQYLWIAEHATIYAQGSGRQYCLVSFEEAGDAVIKLSAGNAAACSSTDSVVIHVGSDVSPTPRVVYSAPEFVCTDITADSYQWGYDDVLSLDSVLLPGIINENYYNSSPDLGTKNYWVLTNHNGCLQKSYYNTPAAIENTVKTAGTDILLFPNPSGEIINFRLPETLAKTILNIKLTDVAGKTIKSLYLSGNIGSMELKDLPSGMYILLFSTGHKQIGGKAFVKQ